MSAQRHLYLVPRPTGPCSPKSATSAPRWTSPATASLLSKLDSLKRARPLAASMLTAEFEQIVDRLLAAKKS